MGKLNSRGLGAVEGLLIFLVVAIIGGTGYYVWHAQQNTNKNLANDNSSAPSFKKKASTTPKQIDPYAGWKSYTLKYEKLTFKYPSDWTVADYSTTQGRHDAVTLNASDGFSFTIDDGIQQAGDYSGVPSSPLSVTYNGQAAYFVFVNSKVNNPDGPATVDKNTVASAVLITDLNNPVSYPADKSVIGCSGCNGVNGPESSYLYVDMGYDGKKNMAIGVAKEDPEYKNGVLVVQSMHY